MPVIKESSDELNPAVLVHSAEGEPGEARRTFRDFAALTIATCGVGYIPLAPGTWGSLVGVGLYLIWRSLSQRAALALQSQHELSALQAETLYTAGLLLLITAVTLVGIWGASRAERLLGRKDPGKVVVDEVAGQLITLLFVPLEAALNWWIILAGFLLFRLFDIWKPYPARRLEVLESGLGIMADDLVAGAYGAIVVAWLVTINQLL